MKQRGKYEIKCNWICYLDIKKDKVGIIEDDHMGADAMVKSRPGWKHLGYYYGGSIRAVKYATEVFLNG